MKKIAILNGPNLNLIGKREPSIYGNKSFEEFLIELKNDFYKKIEITYKQSNCEGQIIDFLHEMDRHQDGIILNAGAYSHTSLAIADAIRAIKIPLIEVHLTNIYKREIVRQTSFISQVAKGVICGFGLNSYRLALEFIANAK